LENNPGLFAGEKVARIICLKRAEATLILARGVVARAGEPPSPCRGVLTEGEEISRLIQAQETDPQVPPGTRIIDFSDSFLFPAFVDAHVHLGLGGEEKIGEKLWACLESGIAALRDAGHRSPEKISQIMGSALDGRVEVQGCGWALHAPGTYGGFLGRSVRDMDEFKEILDGLLRMGALFLKVILTGPVDFMLGRVRGACGFQREELGQMISMAKEAGLGVMVHANGSQGARTALEAGADTLEHGYLMDMETIRLMSQSSVTWVPTLVPVHRLLEKYSKEPGCAPQLLENTRRIYSMQQEHVAAAHELGVPIAAGTDAGALHVQVGESLYEEIRLLSDAGLGISGALRAATLNAAHVLRSSSRPALGCIERGRRAHLLAVAEPERICEASALKAVISAQGGTKTEFC